ncbi:MAG: hypothetical protein ACI9YL_000072 [Luteibaculaceae bacterium]
MNKIVIVSPHWVPSNLTAVHRARMCANALVDLGWDVTVICVDPGDYEEIPDVKLHQITSPKIKLKTAAAKPLGKIRVFGDIVIRARKELRNTITDVVENENFQAAWIFIPSFYAALFAPQFKQAGISKVGIDYIDPWVRSKGNRKGLREKFSILAARFLEPKALKFVDFVTGVSSDYYLPALLRNKIENLPHFAFPYGMDPQDYEVEGKLEELNLPTENFVLYAGALLPHAREMFSLLFYCLSKLPETDPLRKLQWVFLGTGHHEKGVQSLAKPHGIEIIEWPQRLGYLDLIQYQKKAVFNVVLGSTEKHYFPSKVFQNLMAKRPVWIWTHPESAVWEQLVPFNNWKGFRNMDLNRRLKDMELVESLRQALNCMEVQNGPMELLEVKNLIRPLHTFLIQE